MQRHCVSMRMKLSTKEEIAATPLGNEYSIWIDGEQVTEGAADAVNVRGWLISIDLPSTAKLSAPRLSAQLTGKAVTAAALSRDLTSCTDVPVTLTLWSDFPKIGRFDRKNQCNQGP